MLSIQEFTTTYCCIPDSWFYVVVFCVGINCTYLPVSCNCFAIAAQWLLIAICISTILGVWGMHVYL